jgi:hypothetical protein
MIRVQTSDMFFAVMNGGNAPEFYRQTAELLTDVWTCEVLALVQGRRNHADMHQRIDTVIDLISRARRGDRPA